MNKIFIVTIVGLLLSNRINAQSYIPQKNDVRFKIAPAVPLGAYAFDLSQVSLLPGSPFYQARSIDSGYLMLLDPNRLLARFYENAHLPKKGDAYGGWESDGLSGHSLGHYLSAVSMLYADTKNPAIKERIHYIVSELARCQDARKTGYVGAIPKEDSLFYKVSVGQIKSGGFDLNGGWSPWYTVHKVMAGLVDAYLYSGNQQALQVVKGMADWTQKTIGNLTDTQMQEMLKCEYGGMNDVLAMVYAITGEKKYLDLSNRFYDDFVMQPLSERKDALQNKHSNTNIPKGIGSATQYIYSGNNKDSIIAQYMWRTIVNHHTYANGGNGNYEYFGPEDELNDRLSDDNTETCATYNMLKLTSAYYSWHPSASLFDYYEKALYNGILASQNHGDGMFCYFVPLRMGGKKTYSDQFNTFTCCVGTGMENHTKYTQAIYFQSPDSKALFVNLYIPSSLDWKEQNANITIENSILDSDTIHIIVNVTSKKDFTLKLRKPIWSSVYSVVVNGRGQSINPDSDGYLNIKRQWKKGDKVALILQKSMHKESIVDNEKRIALFYGPVLLAGQLGDTMPDPVYGVPVLLTRDDNISNWVKPLSVKDLTFRTTDVAQPAAVTLKPFYATQQDYYSVYFDRFTNAEWEQRKVAYIAEKKRQQEVEARSIDVFRIGEMQPERDHSLTTTGNSYVSEAFAKHGREARSGGSIAFSMKVSADVANSLLLTYIGGDKKRVFDILVDGQLLVTEKLGDDIKGDKFYDKEYKIPLEWTKGKNKISILVSANHNTTAGRLFTVRTMKE
ncbi:MAG: glycoside hydrolase family 127 protein [Chitinophagaceae bacterium]